MEKNTEEDDAMEIDDTEADAQIMVRDHGEVKLIGGHQEAAAADGTPSPTDKEGDVFKAPTPPKDDGVFKQPQLPARQPPKQVSEPVDVVVLDDDDDDDDVPMPVVAPTPPPATKKPKLIPAIDEMKVEVIDLVQKSANSKCINYGCRSGLDLVQAPNMCLSYYRVKNLGGGKKEVCRECYDIAVREYDMLATKLKAGEVLCGAEVPLRNDTVEIDDSDEEDGNSDEESNYFDQENFDFIKENFEAVLENTLEKFKVKLQIENEMEYIRDACKNVQSNSSKLQQELKETRSKLDQVQISLYNKFRTESVSAGTVIIVDDPTVPPGIPSAPSPIKYGTAYNQPRKSNRVVSKKVSYVHMNDPQAAAVKEATRGPQALTKPGTAVVQGKQMGGKTVVVSTEQAPRDVPIIGKLEKHPLITDEMYYISRENSSGSWIRARFKCTFPAGTIVSGKATTCPTYKVVELKQHKERMVDGKNIASMKPSKVRFEVGTRVVAMFKEISSTGEIRKVRVDPYYPGIVGEPPVAQNRYRYLIFFDIGYSQYVHYNNVHLVYDASKNVWEDMHVTSRSFIKKYLESTDRPMVKLSQGQTIRTEYNGKWVLCTIMDVDCSLVLVFFDSLNRMEWIYRGSTRLSPMFKEEQNATKRHTGGRTSSSNRKLPSESATIVQYTKSTDFDKGDAATTAEGDEENTNGTENVESAPTAPAAPTTPVARTAVRAVARKSTARPEVVPPPSSGGNFVPFLPPVNNAHTAAPPTEPTSKIMYFTPRDQIITQRLFRQHHCSPACKDYVRHNLNKLRGHNPLSKPLLCGWARITMKVKGRKEIVYKAPCSRILRNMTEVHKYLRYTKSDMTVDLFDFNHMVRCLAEFNVECVPDPKDLSKGLEQVPVPVINGINNEQLEFCNYGTKRVPMDDVPLNTDPEFLSGCDCEDDCADKTKCSCWQLTLEGSKYMGKNVKLDQIGYVYRRLHEQVLTGIYECNSRCRCASTCLNRVVQNPMSIKLQVFRTHNRGWGIRCVNDVPQGTFICIYAGTIHTEQMANEDGQTYGDEYFAELDYIENCEKHKEDYEDDVVDPESASSGRRSTSPEPEEEEEEDDEGKQEGRRRRYRKMQDNDFVPSNPMVRVWKDDKVRVMDKALRLRKRKEDTDDKKDKIKRELTGVKKEEVDGISSGIETVTISDDEDDPKEVLSFNPKTGDDIDDDKSVCPSVRSFFNEEEPYIMDTKNAGNIGRFLNHSCSPNVFVQNVFVDTHDVRFPWVAFFCSQFIRAGTELTWNYNYDIGSVPGRVLYCHCGSLECKGRLL